MCYESRNFCDCFVDMVTDTKKVLFGDSWFDSVTSATSFVKTGNPSIFVVLGTGDEGFPLWNLVCARRESGKRSI